MLALSVNASVSQSAENADKDMVIGGPATFEKTLTFTWTVAEDLKLQRGKLSNIPVV